MRLYPNVPSQRLATIVRDLVVLVLLVLFAWLGVKVHDTVDELSVLGRSVRDAGASVEGGFERAAEAVDGAPLVGGEVADGLREAGEQTGGDLERLGRDGEERAHRTANLLGILTFAIPAALLLFQAIPPRVSQIRRLTAASKALGEATDPERRRLLAMRAAFSLPYGQLRRYTPDPFGDLADGRYDALVAAAYEDAGLRPQ